MEFKNQLSAEQANLATLKAIDDFINEQLPKVMEKIFEEIMIATKREVYVTYVDVLMNMRNRPQLAVEVVNILDSLGYRVKTGKDHELTIEWGDDVVIKKQEPSQDEIVRHV